MPTTLKSLDDVAEVIAAKRDGTRQLIAIVGAPGSGKSTLSAALEERLNASKPSSCAVVPMDGFHLDDDILGPAGLLPRKGAPHTFDVGGFVHLHKRLAANNEASIAVPVFDRDRELSKAAARLIDQSVETLLVEGNYLLLKAPGWEDLAQYYALSVFIDVDAATLEARLIKRWLDQGLMPGDATTKAQSNDLVNANLVIEQSASASVRWAQSS